MATTHTQRGSDSTNASSDTQENKKKTMARPSKNLEIKTNDEPDDYSSLNG